MSLSFSFKIKHSQSGFTLVELAIVLMIIGLLIGGVLRGQELMNNTRRTATIQQIKSYQGALATFLDSYAQPPGDISNATNRIPNCTAANFCVNGNSDGIIGNIVVSAIDTNQTGNAAPAVETSMFWKHMALAKLISGINPSANPAQPEAGRTHPVAKIDGMFVAATKTTGSPDNFGSGHLLRLQNGPAGGTMLSVQTAFQIDEKMDDGRPNAGTVAAESVSGGCKTNDGPAGTYNTANNDDTRRCILYFKL